MKQFLFILFSNAALQLFGQGPELNKTLRTQLDTVYFHDQYYRREQMQIYKKFGYNSKEYQDIQKKIHFRDSINQIVVRSILKTQGWPGISEIGEQGSRTLFLVIQHSNQQMQEEYLPMMKEVAKKGAILPNQLALLEDRILLGKGKMQLYGSQIFQDSTGAYVQPIEDVDHLDERRAQVGLEPMADYTKRWNITWSIEQYKNDLPNSPAYKRWLAWQEELAKRKNQSGK
jgi:hypothetical protein